MSRRNILIGSLVSLAFLTGAECTAGDPHPNPPKAPDVRPPATQPTNVVPDPREGDPKPTPQRIVTISAGVPERGMQPWEIIITAPGSDVPYFDEPISGKDYYTRRLFPVDSTATITVEVKPPRAGSARGFCSINAGKQSDGPRYIAGGWRALCTITLRP